MTHLLPLWPLSTYATRRRHLAHLLGDAVLVLGGGETRSRSADTHHRFRPDSNFYYLTGLREPGAVLVLRAEETVLFVRPKDPEAEIWNGRRIGPSGAKEHFGATQAYPLSELSTQLPLLLDGASAIHHTLGLYPALDQAIHDALAKLRRRERFGEIAPETFCDARALLGETRIAKDEAALSSLRTATSITAQAHVEAMQAVKPGTHEYELQATLEYGFRRRGSDDPGYGTIVGAGANATILHYVENTSRMDAGQLVLVDAGAEWDLMTGDVTRTYPVSGRFSPAQRDAYAIVLEANARCIEATRVGATLDEIHLLARKILCTGMIDLGLLRGTVDELLAQEADKKYYMHRTSHWLGADVHDAGRYCLSRAPRPLRPNYVLTIEPGLYIAEDDATAPAELRGLGIRIEDDVLVHEDGPEVLTSAAPKTVQDLEAIVGAG